jgi:hypothetical protein
MKLVKLLSLIIVTLVLTNVTLTNHAVDQSVTVSGLNSQITELEHNNTLLSVKISEAGSLTKLRAGIEAAGFVTSPTIVSLSAPTSVASR